MITVTVYNDISLIPSYWFLGFKILARQNKIRLRFRYGRQAPVPNEKRKWKSVLFETGVAGKTRVGLIDIFDRYDSINSDVLNKVDQYFKFNYNEEFIQKERSEYKHKIFPTGFYFPVRYDSGPPARKYVPRLFAGFLARQKAGVKTRIEDALYSVREYRTLQVKHGYLEYYTEELRMEKEDLHDFFWNVNYWSPKLNDSYMSVATSNQRLEIMRIMDGIKRDYPRYSLSYGFFDNADANRDHPDYVLKPMLPTRQYLNVVARSKISIVSRGLFDCFSWRMGEHMAMGRFALTERPVNKTYVPLKEGENAVFFENDLSDLKEKTVYYLRHDEERKKIALSSQQYFDTWCRPEVQIKYMLNNLAPGSVA